MKGCVQIPCHGPFPTLRAIMHVAWTSYSIYTFLFLISKMEITISAIFSYCVSYME